MICLSLGESDRLQLRSALAKAHLAEIRLDLCRLRPEELPGIFLPAIKKGKQLLATCRPGKISRELRLHLLREAIRCGAAMVDVEMEADALFLKEIRGAARAAGCRLILSYHDFRRTPPLEKLRVIVARGFSLGADLVKVACLVNSGRAAARLLSMLAEPRFQKRVLVAGMGKKGRIVRVAAPLLGSPFTYAAPVRGRETAPGQLALAEMERIFRILGQGA